MSVFRILNLVALVLLKPWVLKAQILKALQEPHSRSREKRRRRSGGGERRCMLLAGFLQRDKTDIWIKTEAKEQVGEQLQE